MKIKIKNTKTKIETNPFKMLSRIALVVGLALSLMSSGSAAAASVDAQLSSFGGRNYNLEALDLQSISTTFNPPTGQDIIIKTTDEDDTFSDSCTNQDPYSFCAVSLKPSFEICRQAKITRAEIKFNNVAIEADGPNNEKGLSIFTSHNQTADGYISPSSEQALNSYMAGLGSGDPVRYIDPDFGAILTNQDANSEALSLPITINYDVAADDPLSDPEYFKNNYSLFMIGSAADGMQWQISYPTLSLSYDDSACPKAPEVVTPQVETPAVVTKQVVPVKKVATLAETGISMNLILGLAGLSLILGLAFKFKKSW